MILEPARLLPLVESAIVMILRSCRLQQVVAVVYMRQLGACLPMINGSVVGSGGVVQSSDVTLIIVLIRVVCHLILAVSL